MANKITTVFADTLDTDSPWKDYPRPQLKRDSYISLNGLWDFAYSEKEPKKYTQKILVPFPPESPLSGIEAPHKDEERLYYRRDFTLPEGFIKSRVLLHFGAVDQVCTVLINGTPVGDNEGGYLPFYFDITDSLVDGENEIKVIAEDTLSHLYPTGKQTKKRGGMWYTPVSGIWQSVWLESVPEKHIRALKITPSADSVTIEVDTDSKNKTITLAESKETFTFESNLITISPKTVKNWSPESPYLYYFTLETETDKIDSYFALRKISVQKHGGVSKLCLNGKPYLFNGLLDQGYFPDGLFLPASSEGYAYDIAVAKSLGFNMLRKHIKVEPLVFYHLCDKLGIVVFQDMVNNSDYSFIRDTALPTVGLKRLRDKRMHKDPRSRRIFRDTMIGTANHLYNVPSLLYYTIFNEGWGQFSADDMYELLRSQDSTRIIDSTSGWFWQTKSDVDSHHIYFKKLRIKIDPDAPAVISEFGGFSHRCEGHLFGDGNYGYTTIDERETFEDRVATLYTDEVLPLVKGGVSALVYTQISDVEDETNGFMTYDRRVLKVDPDRFTKISRMLSDAFSEDE